MSYSNNLVHFQSPTRLQRFLRGAIAAGAAIVAQLPARHVGEKERQRRKQQCVHWVWAKTVMQLSLPSPSESSMWGNQQSSMQPTAMKKWKNSDKRATTVTMFDKMLHWRMKLEGTNAKYWLRRNTSQQQQQIQLYCKPPERWPNWGMLVRRLQWNYVWWNFLSNWYKLVLHA